MTLTLGKKKCKEGLKVCINYEINLLHHVSVAAKRMCVAAAAHEGDDNTPSGPTGRGVKTKASGTEVELVPGFKVSVLRKAKIQLFHN